MTKIECSVKSYFGREVVLPVIGVTKIDENGCFEVSNDVLEKFLEQSGDFFNTVEPGEKIEPQVEKEDLSKSDEDEIKPQTEENELSSFQELLDSKTVNELKELAAPFEKSEWGTLKKADLKEYLLEKLA